MPATVFRFCSPVNFAFTLQYCPPTGNIKSPGKIKATSDLIRMAAWRHFYPDRNGARLPPWHHFQVVKYLNLASDILFLYP